MTESERARREEVMLLMFGGADSLCDGSEKPDPEFFRTLGALFRVETLDGMDVSRFVPERLHPRLREIAPEVR